MVRNFEFDEEVGALYVRLSDKPYAYGRDLDHERRIDFAADDTPIGVEFIDVRSGIDLHDVPAEREIGRIAEELHLQVFA